MAITVFQHWNTGTPGRLGMTLRDHGFKLDFRSPHLPPERGGKPVPVDLDNVQGVIILGGPQNVTDIDRYPWMQREAEFIRAAHAAQLPVIGICLGAQLIAHALGGKVVRRERPLFGFSECLVSPAGHTETMLAGIRWNHPQFFCCGQEVGQTPAGAAILAGDKLTPVQAFRVGLRTYGFLFHFECDAEMLERYAAEDQDLMQAAGLTAGEFRVQIDRLYADYARVSDRLCVNLATFGFPFQVKLSA
jgi:GMP synthase (glutamine-hydrolysing)